MKIKSSRAKQKQQRTMPNLKKKLRSKLPRRRRTQISPILRLYSNFNSRVNNSGFSAFSVDSSSCSYFGAEVSCNSNVVSVESEYKARPNLKKIRIGEIDSGTVVYTRSYCRRKKDFEEDCGGGKPEVSESSCVESNSGADAGFSRDKRLKLKIGTGCEIVKEIRGNEGSEMVTTSAISCVEQISDAGNINGSLYTKKNEAVSHNPAVKSCFEAKLGEKTTKHSENSPSGFEYCEISKNNVDKNLTVSNSESTIEQKPESFGFDSELACTEQFSYEDEYVYSSSHGTEYSEFQSEIFLENSDLYFSEYTPSLFLDSQSEFSEKSVGDSTSSPTFSLLLQYREEFSRSTYALDFEVGSSIEDEPKCQSTFVRFEDEDDEGSYQMLRKRERAKVYLHDYTDEYCSTTEYGSLVLQQRSYMIHWIVEHSTETQLHQETMFLGVSLFDRFLSKGFFKSKRILQIVGIACITLATRIEENQPFNSVWKKKFSVGSNEYSRCEVVAMEWLVQEVLNFQCFLPTIYNFLWFYLKAARADGELEKRTKYLAMLQLFDHVQLSFWPSTVAAALVILASLESDYFATRQRVIETHIRTGGEDLHECIESLEWLLRYI
ncbi:hypothetical protein FEM48_Zijuj10G0114500 [Ziziphus jujuba var. spinosa]|uniref:B-like cyclin n=1 Tax=Ziziphus jujuba var. spinosa TaxID=714518 RepID=A0A978UN41_ZIZJJ|nr:hypothetical protein FEM48_Zijuj10G0114500 [Ziziphus jujuba var. spinosa]